MGMLTLIYIQILSNYTLVRVKNSTFCIAFGYFYVKRKGRTVKLQTDSEVLFWFVWVNLTTFFVLLLIVGFYGKGYAAMNKMVLPYMFSSSCMCFLNSTFFDD